MNANRICCIVTIIFAGWLGAAHAEGRNTLGGMPNDGFGTSVAVSGTTVVIGVPNFDVNEGGQIRENQGAVFVFAFVGGQWREQARLVASDGAEQELFGTSVAVSADTILVGAPFQGANAGAAYVFTRSANTWTQRAKLNGTGVFAVFSLFGSAVALHGDDAIVGAPGDLVGAFGGAGSAHVFVRGTGDWLQQARLVAGDPTGSAQFGRSVAISGDTVLVGAARFSAAYVFVRSGANWTQQQRLSPVAGAESDLFGASVALSGNTALIGAPLVDGSPSMIDSGAAYVFERMGATWTQQARLTASDAAGLDNFGTVALQGNTALIGAVFKLAGGSRAGAAYVFSRSGTAWSQNARLNGMPTVDVIAAIGNAVALSGNTALIGAPQDEVDGEPERGSAHICVGSGGSWSQQQRITTDTGAGSADDILRDSFEPC